MRHGSAWPARTTTPRASRWRCIGRTSRTVGFSKTRTGQVSPLTVSIRRAGSRHSSIRCAGTAPPRPIRTCSSRRSAPAYASTAYQLEPLRKALRLAAGQPVHRRRHRPRQDHRGRPDRPGADPAAQGEDHRRRRAAVRRRAVEGRARRPLRPRSARFSTAPTCPECVAKRGFRRQPLAHAQPLSLVSHNLLIDPTYADTHARVARRLAAGQPLDPGRSPPRRPVERRPLRHRDPVPPAPCGTSAAASSTASSSPRHPTTATRTASPHCSNSWTPYRFTRGVPVRRRRELERRHGCVA